MDNGFRVFVVDDDVLMLEMMADLLREDCTVETFISAQECLRRLHQIKPDMFLLDISMPDVDGYDLCRILKEKRETADIPVTFISANDSAEARLLGYEAGGEDFITKPFSPDELLVKVQVAQRITANKRALHEQAGQAQQAVMSSMSELGAMLQFFNLAPNCKTVGDLGNAMLKVLEHHQLDGAIQLRANGEIVSLSPNGRDLPLEVSVLNNIRTAGRIFQFKSRCVFNYDHVTVMINNMPLEDAERCGRIREHGAMLAEGGEAHLVAFENEAKSARRQAVLLDAVPRLRALADAVQLGDRGAFGQINALMIEYRSELAKVISGLGLTETQEQFVAELANDYVQRIAAVQNDSQAATGQLEQLATQFEVLGKN